METGTRHPSPGPIQPAHGPISLRTCSTVEHSLCPRGHSSVVVAPAPYVAGRPAAGPGGPAGSCWVPRYGVRCGQLPACLAAGHGGVLALRPPGVRMRPGSARRAAFELRKDLLFQRARTGRSSDHGFADSAKSLNRGAREAASQQEQLPFLNTHTHTQAPRNTPYQYSPHG
jgi:hypothetical protein